MLEALFNVDPGALSGARLMFAVSWPVLGVLAAGAVLVALVFSGYLGGFGRRSAPGRQPLLAGLRGALALAVVFVLARPELVVRAPAHDGAAVLVLVDQSLSMGIADGSGAATRGEQAASLLQPLTGSLARELEARFEVRYQGFAAGLRPPGLTPQEGDGAVSDTLGALLEAVRSQRLAGVVVAGDGGQVAARRVEETLTRLRAAGVPVHAVGIGSAGPSPDVAVAGVSAPETALEGDALDLTVWLEARGFDGRTVTVTARDNGVLVGQTTAVVQAGRASARVPVTLDEPGMRALELAVLPGGDDLLAANDMARKAVQVRARPVRVMHFEGEPRFEVKFLRRAVADDPAIALSSLVRTGDNRFLRLGLLEAGELGDGFPATAAELFHYQVLVLGSVEAAAFSEVQLALLEDFVSRRGGSVLFLGGRRALAEGGFAGTPVAGLLPVQLEVPRPEFRTAVSAVLTRDGLAHPVTRDLPGLAGQDRALPLPALAVVNPLRVPKPGASVLLQGDDAVGAPLVLLAWQRFGAGRVAVLPVRDSWRWRMHADVPPDDRTHEMFWRRLLRWLAREVPGQVEVSLHPEVVAAGQTVSIRARLRDESWSPLRNATPRVLLSTPLGDIQERAMSWEPGEDGMYQASFTATHLGMHEVRVVSGEGKAALEGSAGLLVDAAGSEFRRSALDEALLQRIAGATGGSYRPADGAEGLADRVAASAPATRIHRSVPLWNAPALLLLMLVLALGEWWLRRRRRELP